MVRQWKVAGKAQLNLTIGQYELALPAGLLHAQGGGLWSVAGLEAALPADFGRDVAFSLSVETTDGTGAHAAKAVTRFDGGLISVTPVADVPTLAVRDARGLEDGSIVLDIRAAQTGTDGSEILTLVIDDAPAGALFFQNGEAVGTLIRSTDAGPSTRR